VSFLIRILATGFFIGYIPLAGGTWASLAGCALWAALSGSVFIYPLTAVVVLLGFPVSGYAERRLFDGKDPGQVVIDEIAGMLITYASFSFSTGPTGLLYAAAGFLLFRLFDILKPFPLGVLQSLEGGAGVMLDDIAAGVYANAGLQVTRVFVRALGPLPGGGAP
jgi:phosphatidylglycerophosphatase A